MKLDHGAIGNGRVLALVGPDTSIDWLCLPRFDSRRSSRGCSTRSAAAVGLRADRPVSSAMAYLRNTNVLRTEVVTAQGRCEVYRFRAAACRPA